ncbi:hypothetical protein RJ639_042854 [Escallonia herrerae]|uniref:Protein kinase domain-containing protein n=1 Tax=Escallonia herrerae TaxID=1293975 RepID=A0AA88WC42_9ASTE|nr:hypothetical protein RJ639_042854 [Escallonia herrerae]
METRKIGKEKHDSTSQGYILRVQSGTASSPGTANDGLGGKRSKDKTAAIVLSVIGGVFLIFLTGVAAFCLYTHRQKRGGFGTVYRGELHDGTKIAAKRMESGVIAGNGLAEFKSEIAVLTKVRHRHLCALLLGYCLDRNEKLLMYEYMPQGALNKHLFN